MSDDAARPNRSAVCPSAYRNIRRPCGYPVGRRMGLGLTARRLALRASLGAREAPCSPLRSEHGAPARERERRRMVVPRSEARASPARGAWSGAGCLQRKPVVRRTLCRVRNVGLECEARWRRELRPRSMSLSSSSPIVKRVGRRMMVPRSWGRRSPSLIFIGNEERTSANARSVVPRSVVCAVRPRNFQPPLRGGVDE